MNELTAPPKPLSGRFRPSDTAPLRPAHMTQIEATALEERCLRFRDARIARCFRLSPAYMTRLRHDYPSSYAEMEGLWFTEGHTRLAEIQRAEARREAARDQRLRECLRMQAQRDVAAACDVQAPGSEPRFQNTDFQDAEAQSAHRRKKCSVEKSREESDENAWGWATLLLGAAIYAVYGLYPGGWAEAWALCLELLKGAQK